jgi:hypothetical protein
MAMLRDELTAKMSDRYYGSDARRDFELRDKRLDSLDKRLSAVEERLWRRPDLYRPGAVK